MAMTLSCNLLHVLNFFIIFITLLRYTYADHFRMPTFVTSTKNILYQGDATPRVREIELTNQYDYISHVGWATYARSVQLWDSDVQRLSDFTTRFSFSIDTQGHINYGHGLAFFMAPLGYVIPPNSAGGFLGLFNITTAFSSSNQIIMVEFDSYSDSEWDPPDVKEHVGINNNSISSVVYTRWNASFHSGDIADTTINYNATTKNLSVFWSYRKTFNPHEKTSLSYIIDLREILPEWVMIGFSAATGQYIERHILESWEFDSSLNLERRKGMEVKTKIIISVLVSMGALIPSMIAIAVLISWRRKKILHRNSSDRRCLTSIHGDFEMEAGPRAFTYNYLASSTNNFSDDRKLGKGGFGAVYKGYLTDLDVTVAVKRISRESRQGKKEYMNEVNTINRLRHRNLVQLIGWCHDKGEFLLVYEFMPNGSLDTHLFGKRIPLTWAARYKISLGLAAGLLYLHEEWEQCVVHRDIKSSNIMLDSNFNVKLGDFGFARLMDHEISPQTTGLAGTLGYMAPEYINTGRASKESDVYSFGVVALEIATGKKATNPRKENSRMGLVEWIWDLYGKGKLVKGADEKLAMNYDVKQVEVLMTVGLWCAHPDCNSRPSIRQVIQAFNFEVALPNLPTKMPVAVYQVPIEAMSSGEPSIADSSILAGR